MRKSLKFLVLWLVFVALPFQGYAAMIMMGCGATHHDGYVKVMTATPEVAENNHERHRLSAPDHDRGDTSDALGAIAVSHHHQDCGSSKHGTLKCSACAACCVGAAIGPTLEGWLKPMQLSSTLFAFRSPHFYSFVPETPDRPPYRLIA